jgi:hypothetical protein
VPGVPLARRNLFADRRRLTAGVVGVGLAVMLILLLEYRHRLATLSGSALTGTHR